MPRPTLRSSERVPITCTYAIASCVRCARRRSCRSSTSSPTRPLPLASRPRPRPKRSSLQQPLCRGGRSVATFALIHGGGGTAWDWHLVVPVLRECGHDPVAVELPGDDESAGWSEYTDTVVRAVGRAPRPCRSSGIRSAASRRPSCVRDLRVELLVLVAGNDPLARRTLDRLVDEQRLPGERVDDDDDVFYHDVSPALAAEARRRERNETSKALHEAWPLKAWPDTPTRYLLCRDDRMFPGGLGAPPRPRAARHRGRRDRRRALHLAQPASRARRAPTRVRRGDGVICSRRARRRWAASRRQAGVLLAAAR